MDFPAWFTFHRSVKKDQETIRGSGSGRYGKGQSYCDQRWQLSLSIKEATDMMAKEIEEEVYEVPDAGEQATTSLGSLFANIKLD